MFSQLRIWIMNQKTVNQKTSDAGVSDATSLMTPNTMQEPASEPKASESTTDNPLSLVGRKKKPTRKDLIKAVANDELHLHLAQVQLEAYKPAMDALKLYKEIYGSQSPNLYMSKNKQVAAICQMNGINDPVASRKQRIAAMTCYEMIHETIMRCLEMGMDKDQVKQSVNDALQSTGEFFGLGNKKAVAARNKRKAA